MTTLQKIYIAILQTALGTNELMMPKLNLFLAGSYKNDDLKC